MNTLITPSIIAKEALMQLRNNMVMGGLVHREYKKEFAKVGSTISIRKPVKFLAKDGQTRVNQNVDEATVPFVINKRKHVSWEFNTQDLTLTIEKFSERYIQPAAIALSNIVDSDLCGLHEDLFFNSGAAGTTQSTFAGFADPAKVMNDVAVPMDKRNLVLDPTSALAVSTFQTALNAPNMVNQTVRSQKMGDVYGMSTFMDQNIKKHTAGTQDGNYVINGANQTGSSLAVNTGTGTWVVGDQFTIAGVNSVNPVNFEDTGDLQVFVVTAASAGGAVNLSIAPSIITSGAYQTVTGSPANGAAITGVATHKANLAFHRNAFGLVMVPLEMPDGAVFKSRATDEDAGISIRVIKSYDVDEDTDIIRLDILYGVKTIYPELGVRFLG